MERWQSLHEHRVDHNLSESGVLPFTLAELEELAGVSAADQLLGYTQTNGTRELRERIAALYPGADAENVLVTVGGAEANFLALWHLVSPDDRVAIVEPTYGQTPGLARGFGAEVRSIPLVEAGARGWQPEPGAAAEATGPDARLLVVTNPNNPTGAVLDDESREELLRAADASGAWILSDEVYVGAEVVEEGGELLGVPETGTLWGERERVLVTGSLSKAYGLPGLRLGWLVGPRDTVAELWARKDYTTIAPAALSDRLAAAALAPDVRPRILARSRSIVRDNLAVVRRWLEERPSVLTWRPPDAGAICWIRLDLPSSSAELAERLRTEESVLVVPGEQFGREGYLRIGFGIERAELEEALRRTGRLLDRLTGG